MMALSRDGLSMLSAANLLSMAPIRWSNSQRHLTSWPVADKFLTPCARELRMAIKPPRPNDGPVFRTLREISKLPLEQRLDAFVDRLDLLDEEERDKVVMNAKGDEYPACSNAIRLKILDVGKQWLHDAEKFGANGNAVGKLAGLHVFSGERKAS